MIVGNVELLARAETGGFYESLVKGTNPAADKAGADAGRLFGQAFVKAAPPLAGALVKNGEAFVATAESQGQASGEAFSTAYIAGLERAGVATAAVFRDPAVTRGAETEGATAGRAFATGVEGQLPLFGEEGLTAGRAFSRSFIEGTSTMADAAAAQGAEAGRAFVSGDLEQIRAGQVEIVAAIREQGAALVASQEESGAAAGAAFARGQRRGATAGSAETSALSFGRLGQGAEAAGLGAGARFAGALNKGVAIGVVAAVAGTAYMAGQFQQKTNILVTAAGEDARALGMVRQGILDIATSTGTKWQDLTDGMYQVEKAGYRGADGLTVLRAAAQAAREEGADLATVTKATTSVMASYHLGVDQAVGVTNAIKTAAGESKTTMEQFAGALSTVLPIASANHIAFSDVAGAMATLTQHGTSADEATQELSNTIRNLAAPNAVASKEMAQLGINSNEVSQSLGTRGLTGTLDFLSKTVLEKMGPSGLLLLNTFNQSKIAAGDAQQMFDHLSPAAQKIAQGFKDGSVSVADFRKQARALPGEQGALAMQFFQTYSNAMGFQNALKQGGPAAQTYSAAIKAMTGGANGLNTTLQITGESLAGTEERSKRVADAMAAGGRDVQGWASTQKLFNVQLDIAKQKLAAAAITVGNQFLPALTGVAKLTGSLAGGIEWAANAAGKLLGPAFHDLGKQLSEFGRIVEPAFKAFRDSPLFKPVVLVLLGALVAPFLALAGVVKLLGLAFQYVINPVARFIAQMVRDVPNALGAVGRFFQRMWADVTGWVTRTWATVTGFFSRMWRDVTGFASRIWHDVTGFFTRIYHDVTGAIGSAVDFIGRHWRLLIAIFAGPLGFAIDLVYKFRVQIGGFFERLWRDVSGFAARMWRDVTGFFSRMWHDVAGFVLRMWRDVAGFFSRMWADVTGFTSRIWRDVTGWFSRLWRDVTGFASRIWHDVSGFFSNLWHDVAGFAGRIWRDVTGWFSRLRDDTTRTANDLWHKVMAPFRSMWGDLKSGFEIVVSGIERTWHKLGEIFRKPVNFLIRYVYDDGIMKVWNFVMDVVGEPKGKLNKANEIPPFAAGGGTAGPWRGDDRYIKVGGNEHVLTSEEVNAAGGHQAVASWRSSLLGGRPVRVMGEGPDSGYVLGGGVMHDLTHNKVTDAIGGIAHDIRHPSEILPDLAGMIRGATADVAGPAMNAAVSLLAKLLPGNSPVDRATVGMGHAMVDKAMNWIRGQDAKDQAAMAALGGPAYDGTGDQWVHGVGLKGLNLEFFNRMHRMAEAMHTPISVTSGFRDIAKQRVLYARYLAGTGNLAAKPGSSNHEKGLAADIAPGRGTFGGRAGGFGLKFPIPSEAWHIEPAGGNLGGGTYTGVSGGPAGETGNVMAVNRAAQARGWGGQLGDLDWLLNRESGFRNTVKNPSSTAYGIFQMLTERSSDVGTQIRDGFGYIAGRYGSPANAAAHERRYGWYDQGGYLMPGSNGVPSATLAVNNTGRREKILDADETEAYEAGQRSTGRRGQPVQVTQTNHIHGVDQPTAERLAARRLGLALQGAGVTG